MKSLTLFISSAAAISYRPPVGSNPWHKDVAETSWNKPDYDINYFVPNLGVDQDIITTDANMVKAEDKLNVTWTAELKPEPHPTNYFVPNLGVDYDIKETQDSIKETEATMGHSWSPVEDEDGQYIVPEASSNGSYSY